MDQSTNPAAASADASHVNAAAPAANAGTPAPQGSPAVNPEALTLAELNQLTGRNFASKEAALKSITDTFKFATARVADIAAKATDAAQAVTGETVRKLTDTVEAQTKEMFYLQNPQYAPHRKLIDSMGKNPAEVVQSDVFKETFTNLSAHAETIKQKTVMESNPRIAAARDGIAKAADLKKSANGFVTPDVEKAVTDAVIDAFNLRG